jgi:hypothetical protein
VTQIFIFVSVFPLPPPWELPVSFCVMWIKCMHNIGCLTDTEMCCLQQHRSSCCTTMEQCKGVSIHVVLTLYLNRTSLLITVEKRQHIFSIFYETCQVLPPSTFKHGLCNTVTSFLKQHYEVLKKIICHALTAHYTTARKLCNGSCWIAWGFLLIPYCIVKYVDWVTKLAKVGSFENIT